MYAKFAELRLGGYGPIAYFAYLRAVSGREAARLFHSSDRFNETSETHTAQKAESPPELCCGHGREPRRVHGASEPSATLDTPDAL